MIDVSVKAHGSNDNDFSDLSAKKSDKSVSFLASQLGETGEADAITTKADDTLLADNNSNGKKSAFTSAELEVKAAKQSTGENLAPSLKNEGKGAENTKAPGTALNAEGALPISDADIEQLAKDLTRSSTQSELSTTSKVLNSLSEAQRALIKRAR
ncbi:hypothetical protein P4S68_23080 [Pseudoalteromonas sp. Hal099]